MKIGLIGDYNANIPAHQAIPIALQLIGKKLNIVIEFEWVPTEEILDSSRVSEFNGLWCVPGSPYKNMAGALCAIQYARIKQIPFLGTCGGFQHALIEYARNVLGWQDAEHAETTPDAARPVIHELACSLIEKVQTLYFSPGTKIAAAYECESAEEEYRCRFGLNPIFESAYLAKGELSIGAHDDAGEVRAVELANGHPFFVLTLFQAERAALRGIIPPLVLAFVLALR